MPTSAKLKYQNMLIEQVPVDTYSRGRGSDIFVSAIKGALIRGGTYSPRYYGAYVRTVGHTMYNTWIPDRYGM